jgi:hypothetical protein
MKRLFFAFLTLAAIFMNACNNTDKTDTAASEQSASVKQDTPVVVAEPPYDPDTNDSIPPGSYGINSSSKSTAAIVRKALQEKYKSDIEKNLIDSFGRKFIFFEYDLNGDSKKEIFVGFRGMYFCGSGGCNILILDDAGQQVSSFTVAGYPVVIDKNSTNGWNDLFIHSGKKDRIVKFDGKKYPSNPSVLPALKVLPGDDLPRALNFTNEPYAWFDF